MMTIEELLEQVKRFARQLVEDSGFYEPPVNPYSIAAQKGIVVLEKPLDEAGFNRYSRVKKCWLIVVNCNDSPARRVFSVAHELLEILFEVPRGYEGWAERVYEFGASELLMPTDWFKKALAELGRDFYALRAKFCTSYESVALKLLEVSLEALILTVVDNKEVSRRVGSMGLNFSKRLKGVERAALEACYATGKYGRFCDDEVEVECFPVPVEGDGHSGIRRVIMFSYLLGN